MKAVKNVSDLIAEYFSKNDIGVVFGIIGAGNAQIFDAIHRHGKTKIICVHHEQAAVMAAMSYYRITNKPTVVLLTTGAGSSNAVTGVLSAWMDSIPVIILSGNENSKYTKKSNGLRIWGVQGYDSTYMVKKITKWAYRLIDPNLIINTLKTSFNVATNERPGPIWIDIPMNIQSKQINIDQQNLLKKLFLSKNKENKTILTVKQGILSLVRLLNSSKKPLLVLGHGVRLSGAGDLIFAVLKMLNIPYLLTWQAADLTSSSDQLNFGRAGVYGQRAANFILQNCDALVCIGTRLAIPQVGYNIQDFAREAKILSVDIDEKELLKFGDKINYPVKSDAKIFLNLILENKEKLSFNKKFNNWVSFCKELKKKYPIIEKGTHDDSSHAKGIYINSYKFIKKIENFFSKDQVIVTDMGTALLTTHYGLSLKSKQRLITSTGLGEMGYGLPASIGVTIAGKKEVVCLNCDGGMMLNLQELQTIAHYSLPIKIFIFNNDGYLMIKHTQKAIFNGRYVGTNKDTGVSCPNYSKIAKAFGIDDYQIRTWNDFDKNIEKIMQSKKPLICEVFTDPEQPFLPKLSVVRNSDGNLQSPELDDLSPLVDRLDFEEIKTLKIKYKIL